MTKRLLINIQYIGKNYNGFQKQKNNGAITIQSRIEEALYLLYNKNIEIVSSGRLDSGVDALNLGAHIDIEDSRSIKRICASINHYLPDDIKLIGGRWVSDDFHARYNCKSKVYEYRLYISDLICPVIGLNSKKINISPNLKLMKKASKILTGTHDFRSFMSKKSSVKSTIRTVKYISINKNRNEIVLTFCADGFLYNMIRIMVGTILDAGYEKISLKDVKMILHKKNRVYAGTMVEAKGLRLINCKY